MIVSLTLIKKPLYLVNKNVLMIEKSINDACLVEINFVHCIPSD